MASLDDDDIARMQAMTDQLQAAGRDNPELTDDMLILVGRTLELVEALVDLGFPRPMAANQVFQAVGSALFAYIDAVHD